MGCDLAGGGRTFSYMPSESIVSEGKTGTCLSLPALMLLLPVTYGELERTRDVSFSSSQTDRDEL